MNLTMKLDSFLRREIPKAQVPKAIGLVFLIKYSWLIIFSFIMWVVSFFSDAAPEHNSIFKLLKNDSTPLLSIVLLALIEEVKYRLPLSIFVKLKFPIWAIIIVAIILSVIFGLGHGNALNILTHGWAGLLYCVLYLKCGGMQGKPGKAIFVTTLAHSLNNILAYYIQILAASAALME